MVSATDNSAGMSTTNSGTITRWMSEVFSLIKQTNRAFEKTYRAVKHRKTRHTYVCSTTWSYANLAMCGGLLSITVLSITRRGLSASIMSELSKPNS